MTGDDPFRDLSMLCDVVISIRQCHQFNYQSTAEAPTKWQIATRSSVASCAGQKHTKFINDLLLSGESYRVWRIVSVIRSLQNISSYLEKNVLVEFYCNKKSEGTWVSLFDGCHEASLRVGVLLNSNYLFLQSLKC